MVDGSLRWASDRSQSSDGESRSASTVTEVEEAVWALRQAVGQLRDAVGEGVGPLLEPALGMLQGAVGQLADAMEWAVRTPAAIMVLALVLLPVGTTAVRTDSSDPIRSPATLGIAAQSETTQDQTHIPPLQNPRTGYLPGTILVIHGQQWEVQEMGVNNRGLTMRLALVPQPSTPPVQIQPVEEQVGQLALRPPCLMDRLRQAGQGTSRDLSRAQAEPMVREPTEAEVRANHRTQKRKEGRRRQKERDQMERKESRDPYPHPDNSDTDPDDTGIM